MSRSSLLIGLMLLSLAPMACSSPAGGGGVAPLPDTTDAGVVNGTDTITGADTTTNADTGSTVKDTTTATKDAGTVTKDAGTPPVDGGTPVVDAGGDKDAGGADDTAAPPVDAGGSPDAGGDQCLPKDYKAKPEDNFGTGCSASGDAAYVAGLAQDAAKGSAFRQLLTNCMLTSGCTNQGDPNTPAGLAKIASCVNTCVLKSAEKGISESCVNCYSINGICGFSKCLAKCAVDSGSQGCKDCLACNCDPKLVACMQLPSGPTPGGKTIKDLAAGDLVITEIQANPKAVSDSKGEFFEIYNKLDADVDLSGLVIEGKPGNTSTLDDGGKPMVIKAKSYAVLAISGDTAANGGITALFAYDPKKIFLPNSGGTFSL